MHVYVGVLVLAGVKVFVGVEEGVGVAGSLPQLAGHVVKPTKSSK